MLRFGEVDMTNVRGAAVLLGMAQSSVLRSIRRGELAAVTHGGRLLLAVEEVERFGATRISPARGRRVASTGVAPTTPPPAGMAAVGMPATT